VPAAPLDAPTVSRRSVAEHGDGPAEAAAGADERDGVTVTVTVPAGVAAAVEEPHAAASRATGVSQHTPSIRRPVITDAAMVTIPVPVLDVTRYDAARAAVVAAERDGGPGPADLRVCPGKWCGGWRIATAARAA
jgi:hypothetical protein